MIRQFLKVAFQMICAGATRTRHGGSEESVDAVRRQFSEWVSQSQLTFLINILQAADEAQRSKRLTPSGSALRGRGSAGRNSPEGNRKVVRNEGDKDKRGRYFNS